MNYYLLSVDKNSESEPSAPDIYPQDGIFIFYVRTEKKFFYLYSARRKRPIPGYPWRRGVPLDKFPGLRFMEKIPPHQYRRIRRNDFLSLLREMKNIQRRSNNTLQVQWSGNEMMIHLERGKTGKIFHLELDADVYKKIYDSIFSIYRDHQNEIRAGKFSFPAVLEKSREIKRLLFNEKPHLVSLMHRLDDFSSIRITSFQYKKIIALRYILFENRTVIHILPKPVEFFGKFAAYNRRDFFSPIRKVIVITNLNGQYLEHLQSSLEFWSTGPVGFIWKHVYGRLSADQLKKYLSSHYDIIIYRGHAKIINRKIFWPVTQGEMSMDKFFYSSYVRYYIQLACNEMDDENELDAYPFDVGLLPVSYLPDADYSGFIRSLFQEIAHSSSFVNSMVKTMEKFPELKNYFSIWQ